MRLPKTSIGVKNPKKFKASSTKVLQWTRLFKELLVIQSSSLMAGRTILIKALKSDLSRPKGPNAPTDSTFRILNFLKKCDWPTPKIFKCSNYPIAKKSHHWLIITTVCLDSSFQLNQIIILGKNRLWILKRKRFPFLFKLEVSLKYNVLVQQLNYFE